MPQVRVDPLTGLKTIIAGERADRPGAGFDVPPDTPIDPATDPFLPGHEDQTPPEVHAERPDGSAPDTPGWTVRVVPNRYPALDPLAPSARERRPSRPVHGPAREGRARGHRQRARSRQHALGSLRRAGRARGRGVACAHARARGRRLPAPDRQRAPRSRRVASAHPRAAVRDGLRARRRGPRARALRRVRRAHDGRQPARRPRPGGGAPARADRGDRRRGGADGAVRLARAVSSRARPAAHAGALRGRRPVRRGDAVRRAAPPARPARRQPAAEPLGADRTERRRALQLADRDPPRLNHLAGLELGTGVNLCTLPPEQAAAELRDL